MKTTPEEAYAVLREFMDEHRTQLFKNFPRLPAGWVWSAQIGEVALVHRENTDEVMFLSEMLPISPTQILQRINCPL